MKSRTEFRNTGHPIWYSLLLRGVEETKKEQKASRSSIKGHELPPLLLNLLQTLRVVARGSGIYDMVVLLAKIWKVAVKSIHPGFFRIVVSCSSKASKLCSYTFTVAREPISRKPYIQSSNPSNLYIFYVFKNSLGWFDYSFWVSLGTLDQFNLI